MRVNKKEKTDTLIMKEKNKSGFFRWRKRKVIVLSLKIYKNQQKYPGNPGCFLCKRDILT